MAKKTRKRESRVSVDPVPTSPLEGIKVDLKYKNHAQKEFADLIKQHQIVICSGSPGTGKTMVSCYEALRILKTDPSIKEIVLVKSVTQLKEEELGYMKGDLREKMEPFVHSFIYNFEKIIPKSVVKYLRDIEAIRVMPIAMMRGINLDNCVVLVDEVQNISIQNAHTILTRIGFNCKMVLLGDSNQSDLRDQRNSSLKVLIDMFKDDDDVGTIHFGDDCIVRNPIIAKIEDKFRERNS